MAQVVLRDSDIIDYHVSPVQLMDGTQSALAAGSTDPAGISGGKYTRRYIWAYIRCVS